MFKLKKAIRTLEIEMNDSGFWSRLDPEEDWSFIKYWDLLIRAVDEEED